MESLTASQLDKNTTRQCLGTGCGFVLQPSGTAIMGKLFFPRYCKDCGGKFAAIEKEEEKQKAMQYAKKRLGLPPRFAECTFENFKRELQYVACEISEKYVHDYVPIDTRKGLYLFGEPGSGKTHLAAAMGNALCLKEATYFTTAPELLLKIKKTFNDSKANDELLDRLSEAPLLIIDDIGSEKPTEWVRETFFVLIDRRYTHYRPTIITSNYSLDTLKDRLGYRIASRIAEVSTMVELRPNDYRIRK